MDINPFYQKENFDLPSVTGQACVLKEFASEKVGAHREYCLVKPSQHKDVNRNL